MANVFRHAHFPPYLLAGECCLRCRDVTTKIPGSTHIFAFEFFHLLVKRNNAFSSKSTLCNPTSHLKSAQLESCTKIMQRTSCQQRHTLIAAFQHHLGGRFACR